MARRRCSAQRAPGVTSPVLTTRRNESVANRHSFAFDLSLILRGELNVASSAANCRPSLRRLRRLALAGFGVWQLGAVGRQVDKMMALNDNVVRVLTIMTDLQA